MKLLNSYLWFATSSCFFFHCSSSGWGDFWTKPIIKTFTLNGQTAIIAGNTITANLKWSNITSLVASYTTDAQSVELDGFTQISGRNINDYSTVRTFRLTGANGTTAEYTVNISKNTFPMPDTGQSTCYDAAVAQPCPFGGFPNQDAEFPASPIARSFTGPYANAEFPQDFITKDNVASLVWKSCSEGSSGIGCNSGTATTMQWQTAVDSGCSGLNTQNGGAGYAGISYWRLPNVDELRLLVNSAVASPATDQANFPATQAASYWANAGYPGNQANAWAVLFTSGVSTNFPKTNNNFVRCVAGGGGTYVPNLIDNGNGTITDQLHNLVWTKCSLDNTSIALQTFASGCANLAAGSMTWTNALNNCSNLNFAGRTWRLPSAAELMTITETNRANPSINTTFFPNTQATAYHVSTTSPFSATISLNVIFDYGSNGSGSKVTGRAVRCVSGP